MYNNKTQPETMSKSIGTSPQMQDVPLSAIEEQEAPHGDPPTVVQKSNSLKRFFKMPLKRTNTKDTVNEKAKAEGAETSNETEQLPQVSQSRFHLRLGGMNKHGNDGNPPTGTAEQKPSTNKVNLKKSISNYWNSVFKRNQHTARHKGGKESDDIDAALNEAAEKLAQIGDEDNKDDDQVAEITPNTTNVSETNSEEALGAVGGEIPSTKKDKAAEELPGKTDSEEMQSLAKEDAENASTT